MCGMDSHRLIYIVQVREMLFVFHPVVFRRSLLTNGTAEGVAANRIHRPPGAVETGVGGLRGWSKAPKAQGLLYSMSAQRQKHVR